MAKFTTKRDRVRASREKKKRPKSLERVNISTEVDRAQMRRAVRRDGGKGRVRG